MHSYLEFEKPVAELDQRIAELRAASEGDDVDISGEIAKLEAKSAELLQRTYAGLTPWQKTQVARHPLHGRTSAITSSRPSRNSSPLVETVRSVTIRRSWAGSRGSEIDA